MQYGFLIDHRRCIGCHACTVACKAENDVPVGSFRTWVKYTEKGTFPAVKRSFAVLRCNHCTDAPCVTICPVTALDKRPDGIVDVDRDVCIGCRACMQACPYDAIYLNDETGSVEKCHYCAHRVEQNLEPACVVVCPEQAIVPGDLHDPSSKIATMVAEHDTERRRTEQGTGPNVHYLGHEPVALEPGAAARPPTYLWSDRPATKPEPWPASLETAADTRTVLDAGHKVEWGWAVALYLVTKGIAGGAMVLAPFAAALGLTGFGADYLPEVLALLFLSVTTFLLVEDLTRPMKFLTLLTRGNRRSWLVKGAYVLIGASTVATGALACRWLGLDRAADALRWVGLPLGAMVAAYTAFLFRQCEGRDLWQSGLVLPHLLFQALLLGAAALRFGAPDDRTPLAVLFLIGAVGHVALALLEANKAHATANARQGAAFLKTLRYGGLNPFGFGLALVAIGTVLAFLTPLGGFGAALAGIYFYEWAFVRAGQLPPLS
ncbi:MAG: 4Fe-4S dicluster domain-containing protein [Planctomycetota bacterium JB042]